MKTEKIDTKNKGIFGFKVEAIAKSSRIRRQDENEDKERKNNETLEQKYKNKQSQKKEKEGKKTITSQQAYEMQKSQSNIKAGVILNGERQKVQNFKKKYDQRKCAKKYKEQQETGVEIFYAKRNSERNLNEEQEEK